MAGYGNHSVGESALTGLRAGWRCGARSMLFLLFPLAVPAVAAPLAEHSAVQPELPKVTIEAAKEQALRREVQRFVAAVVVRPWDESLMRWDVPVCPLVAGLHKRFGEFILWRISKAATDAGAPLAGRACHPNLFVIATDAPDLLLKKWWARNPGMYDRRHGTEPIRRFIDSSLPVRVWYNSALGCGTGAPVNPGASTLTIASTVVLGGGSSSFGPGAPTCTDGIDTHLNYADTRSISSAIVVIDSRQMKTASIQQLADYIALIGLADLRADADPGTTPSILRVFVGRRPPPRGLTLWDRALLYSLYTTRQEDKAQVQDMESTMVRRIEH
jgi:hypothetical protein